MLIKRKTKEQNRIEDLKRIEQYCLLDDDFMRFAFHDQLDFAQYVLRIITGMNDLVLESEKTQYDLKHLEGARSILLDVHGVDSEGKRYDLEVQRADEGAGAERARYHSAAIDIDSLKAGQDFEKLPTTYVIFLTARDVLGEGELLYEIDRTIKKSGKSFNDRAHILYVNCAYNNPADESELAKLAHDFRCARAEDMRLAAVAARVRECKETQKGELGLCKINEKMRAEAAAEAETLKAYEIARKLLARGKDSYEEIAELAGLSLEDVMELAKEKSVNA